MGYKGLVQTIPFGQGGLHTDDPSTGVPLTDLVRANNCTLEYGRLQKAPGSHRYNQTALSGGVYGALDWWPDEITQRLVAITSDGYVWRISDNGFSQSKITPATDATQTTLTVDNQVSLVAGGAESAGRNRKLFIFTGNNPVQVLSGDGTTRTNMSKANADWSGINQPRAGIIHHGRLWAWGNPNNPHQMYASNPDDHEDFQTAGGKFIQFTVYPGEGERNMTAWVYKGRMFMFKYPQGVYYLDDSDPNTNNWAWFKYSDTFGAASVHSAINVLDDMLVANSYGSVTSNKAVQYFGGIEQGDILLNSRSSKYVRDNISQGGSKDRHAIYYADKKKAIFAYRSTSGLSNDRMLIIDYTAQEPKVHWDDKDQPNCLGLMKDTQRVPRPFYGANDGYIYLMDMVDRDVGGSAYTMDVMTPHMDFGNRQSLNQGYNNNDLGEKTKIFDFLELTFEQSGKFNLSVDVYIDGKFSETILFSMANQRALDQMYTNIDRTYDGAPFSVRKQMCGFGRRVSLRLYNSGLRENPIVLSAQVYFRPANNNQKDL